jgi:hypothetical protein
VGEYVSIYYCCCSSFPFVILYNLQHRTSVLSSASVPILSSLQQNASEGGGLSLGSSSIARAPQTRREREEELSRAHSTQQRPVREREREIEHSDEEEEGSAGVMDAAERERLREKAAFDIFNSIDDDGSGFLEPSELPFLLKTLGREVDELQLEGIMRELDDDGDGEISFEGAFLFIFHSSYD